MFMTAYAIWSTSYHVMSAWWSPLLREWNYNSNYYYYYYYYYYHHHRRRHHRCCCCCCCCCCYYYYYCCCCSSSSSSSYRTTTTYNKNNNTEIFWRSVLGRINVVGCMLQWRRVNESTPRHSPCTLSLGDNKIIITSLLQRKLLDWLACCARAVSVTQVRYL